MSAVLWRRFTGRGDPAPAVPPDLARRLARVQLAAARRIAAPWQGAYRSAFRGQGIEFAGVREYVAGDDARTVDWRVTARTGRLAVRTYTEERNCTVLFLADVGPGIRAGSGDRDLLDVTAEAVALLGGAAVASGDRIALAAWSDRLELGLPPRRDAAALLRTVRALLALDPRGRARDLAAALASVPRWLPRAGVLVVISPFLGTGFGGLLASLRRRHELLAVRLWDVHAGLGTATALVPARDAAGAAGWSVPALLPLPADLEAVRADTVTVTPRTSLAPALSRALAARAGRRGA